jgi:hypothetical protein
VNAFRLRAVDHEFDRIRVTRDSLLMLPGETYFHDVAGAVHDRVPSELVRP